MTRRRITVVASEVLGRPGTGGAGTADSLLAVALGRHGHDVELLVASGRDIRALNAEWTQRYESAGVSIRILERRTDVTPPYLAPTLEVFHALRDSPPDLVIANDWRGLAWAALQARHLGLALTDTAFVIHCHGPGRVLAEFAGKVPDTLARFAEEITERGSIELADAVVSPSAWLLDWFREHDWPVLPPATVVQYIRQSAALGETPPPAAPTARISRLAFFGQLREGKGVRIFLEALDLIGPRLLEGVEILFLGAASARWSRERILASRPTARIETDLDQDAALAELRRPGTLAVMPSLLDNAPNTVSECIEHGIPFVATDTGGIAELVAERDRERVLSRPTSADLAVALTRALTAEPPFAAAAPAHEAGAALEAWLGLVENVEPRRQERRSPAARVAVVASGETAARRARALTTSTRSVPVEVVEAASRAEGLAQASADWILFLDEDDLPSDDLIDALVAAQAVSGADVVSAAVRPAGAGLHLFLGDPGVLGLAANHYGVAGLFRRTLIPADVPAGGVDPDWPLLAQLALDGARIVSSPEPLSDHSGRVGTVSGVPGEGLAVLRVFETHGGRFPELPQLAATLAAANARLERQRPAPAAANGFVALARRTRDRLIGYRR
jgi:glycosyltransferase involved in cell wall biosynthesis